MTLALIVVHGVAPSTFEVDEVTVGLLAVLLLLALLPAVQTARLPGGTELEFRQVLVAAERYAGQVRAQETPSARGDEPDEEVEAVAADLGILDPSLRSIAEEDPRAALAALQVDVVRSLRRLYEIRFPDRQLPEGPRLVEELARSDLLSFDQAQLALTILRLGVGAARREPVTSGEALEVLSAAGDLTQSLTASVRAVGAQFEREVGRLLREAGAAVQRPRNRHRVDFLATFNGHRLVVETMLLFRKLGASSMLEDRLGRVAAAANEWNATGVVVTQASFEQLPIETGDVALLSIDELRDYLETLRGAQDPSSISHGTD